MAQRHFPKGLEQRMRDREGEVKKRLSAFELAAIRDEYGLDTLFDERPPPAEEGEEAVRSASAETT